MSVAKALKNAEVEVCLVDKANYHLFQPLLYQVATAALSPGDIAVPIRSVLSKYKNVRVISCGSILFSSSLNFLYYIIYGKMNSLT